MFNHPLPAGTQDDSVLNNRERLRRQHMNRPNMPSTPTLGKSNHFQENANPQQQQAGTSFTIEIATAPKKGPPLHLLERLSKKTSVAKTIKDSEMGDGGNNTATQPPADNTAPTAAQRRQTILEFQKRKSATLKQNLQLKKPQQNEAPNNLTYTTFDTNGLTLDDDLEIGFEKSGSPILSLNGLNRNNQSTPTSNFAFGSQQTQQNVNSQANTSAQQGFQQFGSFNQQQTNNQSNPQWQMEQQRLIEQQKLEQQRAAEQQQLEQQRIAEQQRAAEQLLQQQQLEQQRMAEQQRVRDQQQQQQLDQLNEQQRATAEQQMLQQKQMEQQRMLEQQHIEQEKLQRQFDEQQRMAEQQRAAEQQQQLEQQRMAEQQRAAVEQQHLLQQQQIWQAQAAQAQSAHMQYIPVYQTVPSEEVQRMIHEVQRQQSEFERQRQAHMEMMQRERAELELGKELLKRQQLELQTKLNEVEQIKMGIRPVHERRESTDARRNEVEASRNAKRTVQRQEIIKSKRELNLLNVDKLSRNSREIKREEREEEKKRTRSMLPEGIFSPPRTKQVSRPSLYCSRTTPSSAAKSDATSRKLIETPNSLYSPASSMRGSIRSSVSKSNSRDMSSPSSGQLSKRKQMVLEKTRRKAEEFSRKTTSNNNTPCQH